MISSVLQVPILGAMGCLFPLVPTGVLNNVFPLSVYGILRSFWTLFGDLHTSFLFSTGYDSPQVDAGVISHVDVVFS